MKQKIKRPSWGKTLGITAALCMGLGVTTSSLAWIPAGDTTKVTEVVIWNETGSQGLLFKLANGNYCYANPTQSPYYNSIVTQVHAAYASKANVAVVCYDAAENIGGYTAHRLHRFVTTN